MSLLFIDDINRFCHDDALLSLQLLLIQINLFWVHTVMAKREPLQKIQIQRVLDFKTRCTLYFEDKHMP